MEDSNEIDKYIKQAFQIIEKLPCEAIREENRVKVFKKLAEADEKLARTKQALTTFINAAEALEDLTEEGYLKLFNDECDSFDKDDLPLILREEMRRYIENDDDILDGPVKLVNKDPFTQAKIKKPVKNERCGHVYDEDAVTAMLNGKPGGIKCPMSGCLPTFFIKDDLTPYPEYLDYFKKKKATETN